MRSLREVLIVSTLFSMAWETFAFAVPIYGAGVGLSATTIGTILGAFALATFAVRLALPALSRRSREWRLVAVALAIACAIFLGFPFFERGPLLLAFVLGLGSGNVAADGDVAALLGGACGTRRRGGRHLHEPRQLQPRQCRCSLGLSDRRSGSRQCSGRWRSRSG